jgi:hypothetical protein
MVENDERYYLMDIEVMPPTPYGFNAKDRRVISFIQCIPSRLPRSTSNAFNVLYGNGLYLIHHFVYLIRKITFYKWVVALLTTTGKCRKYVCNLSFYMDGIVLQIDCQLIKKYLDVELTVPVNDIRMYDHVQRVLYSNVLVEEYEQAYIEWRRTQRE